MSGRGLPTGMHAALAADYVQWFPLVHMALDTGDVRLCGAPFDVTVGGHTYSTLLGLGSIEPIIETDDEQQGLSFTVSGVPDAAVAMVLAEKFQGRAVTVRMAVVDRSTDPGTVLVEDATWQGLLDVPILEDGATPTVRITAEHQLVAWDEPVGAMYSDADQQERHPGDRFFEYTASLVEATIIWPSAEAQRG